MNPLTNILAHPKTSLEGLGWGVGVAAIGYYALDAMHCDLASVSGANFIPFLMGAIPVIRGAFAQDRTGGTANVSQPTPPAA